MALTPTVQIPLNFKAPDFSLPEPLSGELCTWNDIQGLKGTVVMFICNHCPYVVHVVDELVKLGMDYKNEGIGFVAISSNDVSTHPNDGPYQMAVLAREKEFPFPYLYDESQEIARSYDAACTPDFSVFSHEGKCIYRGQLDGSRPGNQVPVNGEDMRKVLDLLVAHQEVPAEGQVPSIGCNIKWK
ncbi:MAG: peroxiredoxin [Flavobacteriales bacterium]|jgi:peroxiredoxin